MFQPYLCSSLTYAPTIFMPNLVYPPILFILQSCLSSNFIYPPALFILQSHLCPNLVYIRIYFIKVPAPSSVNNSSKTTCFLRPFNNPNPIHMMFFCLNRSL